jgi:hypothetical protein
MFGGLSRCLRLWIKEDTRNDILESWNYCLTNPQPSSPGSMEYLYCSPICLSGRKDKQVYCHVIDLLRNDSAIESGDRKERTYL